MIAALVTGAFSIRGDWINLSDELPPDDATPIELRFRTGGPPMPTTGRAVRRNYEIFGPPPFGPTLWRFMNADDSD